MLKEAILHQAYGPYAYPVGPQTLRVTLRAKRKDLVRVHVVYRDRYQRGNEAQASLELVASDALYDYFQQDIALTTRRFLYSFVLDDGIHRVWYTEKGFSDNHCFLQGFQYPYIAEGDFFEPPKWAQGAVVYQIFPERFARGETPWATHVEDWDMLPKSTSRKGGDLQGVLDHLDYLVDLGVEVLYLTPIFTSPSNHKYDTTDYYQIDPNFGDLDLLKKLVTSCHKKGIKVVLDGVFNHCGSSFFAFLDARARGEESAYSDWFRVMGFPIQSNPPNYETFANDVATMPKLMHQNPEVRAYLLDVAVYWIRECDIDGWRLDVANEVDHSFWKAFRECVKREKEDAVIIGEVWHEASPWVLGDEFDAVMNYPFREACIDFFLKGTLRAETFAYQITRTRMNYRESVNRTMYNLLGSHDTARFLTLAQGFLPKVKLAVAFQLLSEGSPMIYYGDEVGMVGENDPDCRRGMIWKEDLQDRELLSWYKKLIALRKAEDVFRWGRQKTLWADSVTNVLGILRYGKENPILVLLNNSPTTQSVQIPKEVFGSALRARFRDLLSEKDFALGETWVLPAFSLLVLKGHM